VGSNLYKKHSILKKGKKRSTPFFQPVDRKCLPEVSRVFPFSKHFLEGNRGKGDIPRNSASDFIVMWGCPNKLYEESTRYRISMNRRCHATKQMIRQIGFFRIPVV
jgi:hypothetical protein